jgi:hypothetical protein
MVLFVDNLFKTIGEDSEDFSEAFYLFFYALGGNRIDRYDDFGAFKEVEGAFIETG